MITDYQNDTNKISPEVQAELERLGVDDLPWEVGPKGRAQLFAYGGWVMVGPTPSRGVTVWGTLHPTAKKCIAAVRARHGRRDDPDPKPTHTVKELLDNISPSNVSWTREQLQGEPIRDGLKFQRRQHAAICSALVELRDVLARPTTTKARLVQAMEEVCETLDGAL